MAVPTPSPIKQGLVRRLRQRPWFSTVRGGIHQNFAPAKAKYPFITYTMVTAPNDFTWGSTEIHAMFDVFAWSEKSVEAENLDALIADALHEAPLEVGEQSLLQCRRMGATPTGPTTDATGRRIYQIGGTYVIWTDHPNG
jgi:hypothetical protein